MKDKRKIELRPAFEWTCEDCGTDNFERSIVIEDMESLREEFNLDDEQVILVQGPENVTCSFCKSEFDVEDES